MCKECGGQLPDDWPGEFCSDQCMKAHKATT